MATVYNRHGTSLFPADQKSLVIEPVLPPGNYIIKATPQGQLYFDEVDSFTRPSKIYGDTLRHAGRIMNTFLTRHAGTGVLLNGEKGSGKTLLAKMLSIVAAESGMPTVIINAPWRGDAFNQLIQGIDQPAIILFDEFEKIYDREEQQEVLTLFDGVFPSKKLFIVTCNDKWRIDEHMRNRPGRMFYMLDFNGLDQTFIREYCEDRLNDKTHIDRIIQMSVMFNAFNFDMLQALVEEMNRYNEDPHQAIKMLNAKPNSDGASQYLVYFDIPGFELSNENSDGSVSWQGTPLANELINFDLYLRPSRGARRGGADIEQTLRAALEAATAAPKKKGSKRAEAADDDGHSLYIDFYLKRESLVKIDPTTESFVYQQGPIGVTFKRKRVQTYNYGGFEM